MHFRITLETSLVLHGCRVEPIVSLGAQLR